MANYMCTFRTNYFKVKDDKKFEEFMTHVYAEDLELFHMTDKNGNKLSNNNFKEQALNYFNSKYNNYLEYRTIINNALDNYLILEGYFNY